MSKKQKANRELSIAAAKCSIDTKTAEQMIVCDHTLNHLIDDKDIINTTVNIGPDLENKIKLIADSLKVSFSAIIWAMLENHDIKVTDISLQPKNKKRSAARPRKKK